MSRMSYSTCLSSHSVQLPPHSLVSGNLFLCYTFQSKYLECLLAFTIIRFIRHRREMNEILSTDSNMTSRRCMRALTITYVTLLLDVPVLAVLITSLIAGRESSLDRPYQSWTFPLSLSLMANRYVPRRCPTFENVRNVKTMTGRNLTRLLSAPRYLSLASILAAILTYPFFFTVVVRIDQIIFVSSFVSGKVLTKVNSRAKRSNVLQRTC